MDIFKIIYSWFYNIYSIHLYDYLKGVDCDGAFVGPDHFITIGLIMISISLFVAIVYYYVINHPRFNRLWHWLIVLLTNAIINLLVGFGYVYSKLYSGVIPACFTHAEIETTEEGYIYGVNGTERLTTGNCWQFGIANSILAVLAFVLFSMIIKWWSRNCKRSPFL